MLPCSIPYSLFHLVESDEVTGFWGRPYSPSSVPWIPFEAPLYAPSWRSDAPPSPGVSGNSSVPSSSPSKVHRSRRISRQGRFWAHHVERYVNNMRLICWAMRKRKPICSSCVRAVLRINADQQDIRRGTVRFYLCFRFGCRNGIAVPNLLIDLDDCLSEYRRARRELDANVDNG